MPEVGQVYRVRTLTYSSSDPAPARPAVVVDVPAVKFARIRLVTRTSKNVSGVAHAADPALGLDRDGVFADLVSVEPALWRPENATLLGVLPGPSSTRYWSGPNDHAPRGDPRNRPYRRERSSVAYRTVWSVAISRNFPPPPGSSRWDESAVTETAHDLLDGERGIKRVTDIAIRSVDDSSFERLLEAAVVNFLREGSRRTDMGKLILRVTEVLRDDDAFQPVGGKPARWSLVNGESSPS